MRQFIQSSMELVCHFNILLCITWKVEVVEWTFAVHWAEMRRSHYSSRKNIKIYRPISFPPCTHTTCSHAHTLEIRPCGWTENHFLIHATLHNASLHCVGYRQHTQQYQGYFRATHSLLSESYSEYVLAPKTWDLAPAAEDPCSYSYRSASRSES